MVERQLQRGALVSLNGKAGRLGNALRWRGLQLQIQRCQIARIFGLQQAEVLARKTQSGEDGLRHVHLLAHGFTVLRRFFASHQHPDLRRTIRHAGQPQLQAGRGGVKQAQRHHACRHAANRRVQPGHAAQIAQQTRAGLLAVQQQRGVLAARFGVGAQ